MKFRPGSWLILVVGSLTVWSVIGFVWSPTAWLIPLTLLIVAGLALADFVELRRGLSQLTLRQIVPSPVGRDRQFFVSLEIQNDGPREWQAEVRDESPAAALPILWVEPIILPANEKVDVTSSFHIPLRGRFTFGPAWIRLRGRFGLLEAQRRFEVVNTVDVYPESLLSPHELAKDAADEIRLLDQLRDTRQYGAGTEFESLQEFRQGDDPRHIDWRTSARHRRFVVRRFQVERHRDVMLLVDCGRLMGADAQAGTKLDCAVDAGLRLIRIALRGGDRCGLGIFDDQVVGFLRPIGGANALPSFLSSLHDLQPRWRETDFGPMFARLQSRLTKRALLIILSDVVDAETSTRYRTSLATLARRHVVLFAALQTPLLGSLISTPLDSMDTGFQKAVTFRILREREQAIHALSRGGVHVLDVEPSKLTAPLINQFIEIRRSALV
jgi:uncharacterized protein (DUF58 family)